ncbi:hypothetical protein ACXM0N_15590 [Peribacillus simplex]
MAVVLHFSKSLFRSKIRKRTSKRAKLMSKAHELTTIEPVTQ